MKIKGSDHIIRWVARYDDGGKRKREGNYTCLLESTRISAYIEVTSHKRLKRKPHLRTYGWSDTASTQPAGLEGSLLSL
jgi:hypothetical protein